MVCAGASVAAGLWRGAWRLVWVGSCARKLESCWGVMTLESVRNSSSYFSVNSYIFLPARSMDLRCGCCAATYWSSPRSAPPCCAWWLWFNQTLWCQTNSSTVQVISVTYEGIVEDEGDKVLNWDEGFNFVVALFLWLCSDCLAKSSKLAKGS